MRMYIRPAGIYKESWDLDLYFSLLALDFGQFIKVMIFITGYDFYHL